MVDGMNIGNHESIESTLIDKAHGEHGPLMNINDLIKRGIIEIIMIKVIKVILLLSKRFHLTFGKKMKFLMERFGGFKEYSYLCSDLAIYYYDANQQMPLNLGHIIFEVCQMNLDKLASRMQRDRIHGEGDER